VPQASRRSIRITLRTRLLARKGRVLSQIHHDPVGLGGPVPFGLSVPGDGMMHFNAEDPTGRSYSMWDHALPRQLAPLIVHTKMGGALDTDSRGRAGRQRRWRR
jgi:hypothetical protein